MKKFYIHGMVALTLTCSTHKLFAEGHQDFGPAAHGVNRVIRTTPGFVAFSGDYSIRFTSPRNELGQYEDEVERLLANQGLSHTVIRGTARPFEGVIDPNLIIENRPSVYVGGRIRSVGDAADAAAPRVTSQLSEFDVGIQTEMVSKYRIRPGWSIFFYVAPPVFFNLQARAETLADGRLELNPRRFNSQTNSIIGEPWRPDVGHEFDTLTGRMELHAEANGRARVICTSLPGGGTMWATRQRPINITPLNAPPHWRVNLNQQLAPWNAPNPAEFQGQSALVLFDVAEYETATIKRVTAMTRPAGLNDELDGSGLEATWSNCNVNRVVRNNNNVLIREGMQVWGARRDPNGNPIDVDNINGGDNIVSGYDTPADGVNGTVNHLAFDNRYRSRQSYLSKNIVEFEPIAVLNAQGQPVLDAENRPVVTTNRELRAGIGNVRRYQTETVRINLGMLLRPTGEAVQ